ncbi:MAG TPA: DUF3098 domain-containing protein [Bacteroidota bacterium]|nr:DUF3098 domain-containing protein [Bacteroidota bacterium]
MARVEEKKTKTKSILGSLPFTKTNYQIFGAGLLLLVLGYLALSQEPWDGAMPLVVAPILLVLGYCVVVPLAILFRKKSSDEQTPANSESHS